MTENLFCFGLTIILIWVLFIDQEFCFLLFSANSAAFAAGILFFLTYFPYFFLREQYETMSQTEKMAACLLHNVGMAFGVNTMLIYEGTGTVDQICILSGT